MILNSSSFPLFHCGQVFFMWHALLLLFFLTFSSISLHCSPVQFSFALFMHLLMLLFTSFYFLDPSGSNLFSQFSPFVAQIKNFCSDLGFFLLTMFAKDLPGCFSHCCVEVGDHCIHVCIFTVHGGERCKLPACYSLEGFQHIGIFQAGLTEPVLIIILLCQNLSFNGILTTFLSLLFRHATTACSKKNHTNWDPLQDQILYKQGSSWKHHHSIHYQYRAKAGSSLPSGLQKQL